MTTLPQTASIAIIGAGMVARTHLRALADLKTAIRITGVLSRSNSSATALADEASALCEYDVRVYEGLDEVCTDGQVDWALVLTPPDARLDIVERLARAGKSILTEKPVERDLGAATRIVKTCEQAGITLGVVFQHRTRKASQQLKQQIQSGTLGPLALVEAVVPWWRDQSYYDEPGRGTYTRDGGGVLISQAIHTLDLMLSLAGDVTEVQTMAHTTALHRMEAEDYVTAGLRFASGAIGSLIASTASFPGTAESVTLHFMNCVAHLQSGQLRLIWRNGREETFGEPTQTGGGVDPMAFTHEWHRDVIADFNDAVSHGRQPLVSGRQALRSHALIDALTRSATTKRACTVCQTEP